MPTINKGSDYFGVLTYTGDGAASKTVVDTNAVSFTPDFVWIKGRSGATDHALYDAVRGTTKDLVSNSTAAETTQSTGLTAFTNGGFTIGNLAKLNTSGATYTAWCWKAGGSTSSNTAGSITSTVSVNTTAGFSVVTWTATGSNATIGHGLGVAPKMIITKGRNAVNGWNVYTSTTGNGNYLRLDTTAASTSGSTYWNNTSPTSTVFSTGTWYSNTETYVAYCFAEIAGFSRFGNYTGGGNTGASTPNANGPFIYLGFRPKFVLIKRTSSAADWVIYDSVRGPSNANYPWLYPNSSSAEVATETVDFLSNGFKIRSESGATMFPDGATFIYAAFAEHPFKNSNAR